MGRQRQDPSRQLSQSEPVTLKSTKVVVCCSVRPRSGPIEVWSCAGVLKITNNFLLRGPPFNDDLASNEGIERG
jgi:hypothetical protein